MIWTLIKLIGFCFGLIVVLMVVIGTVIVIDHRISLVWKNHRESILTLWEMIDPLSGTNIHKDI